MIEMIIIYDDGQIKLIISLRCSNDDQQVCVE